MGWSDCKCRVILVPFASEDGAEPVVAELLGDGLEVVVQVAMLGQREVIGQADGQFEGERDVLGEERSGDLDNVIEEMPEMQLLRVVGRFQLASAGAVQRRLTSPSGRV